MEEVEEEIVGAGTSKDALFYEDSGGRLCGERGGSSIEEKVQEGLMMDLSHCWKFTRYVQNSDIDQFYFQKNCLLVNIYKRKP